MSPTSYTAGTCPQCGAPVPADAGQQTTCDFCGATLIRLESREPGRSPFTWGAHFKTVACIDHAGFGMQAFTLLIPADWEFEGQVHWLQTNPAMPAVITCRAASPRGVEVFEVLPNLTFFWNSDPMTMSMFPPGSNYMGSEVRPPAPALEVLRDVVVPRARGQAPGLRVVDSEHLPQLGQQSGAANPFAPAPPSSDGGRLRVSYGQAGEMLEEDFYGVVNVHRQATPAMFGMVEQIFWVLEYLFSFRAAAGRLDGLSNTFMSIVHSFQLNPQWFANYMQISQGMVQSQMQNIQQMGQLSRQISRNNDQISDMIMHSYYERQHTLDHIADQFSQATRGVNEYQHPFEDYRVELPGEYRHAWANALGEYIVTDDSLFNPNIGSTQTWEPMQQT